MHGISLIFSASEEQSALLRLRGRQRQAGGQARSAAAGPDLFLRVVAGWGRGCACDASWSPGFEPFEYWGLCLDRYVK